MGTFRPLELVEPSHTMADRLRFAADRVVRITETGEAVGSTRSLRTEQVGVYTDFANYLIDVAGRPAATDLPMGRLIMPPRTGKTVVAGHCIANAALTAAFIVPTKTLVEQVRKDLQAQLPWLHIGVFYGEEKSLVPNGVNIATYQNLQRSFARTETLPRQIRHAALVFADEGHRAMTPGRMRVLREGFDRHALRIALTATPQYDEERTLAHFFPELIHEITAIEAVELGLIAPFRVWVAEVDVDASEVRIIGGEFEDQTIGNLMSAAPFFRATEVYRWDGDNARRAALICCASRKQALELHAYLRTHRPAGTPEPRLILGTTPREERRPVLAAFERGEIDTLINVGVLLEGWNSPRCKLLIDLAPSLSRVRAMQKFFRPMTKQGQEEAQIYLLIPKNLPRMPLLPMELFGWPSEIYDSGALIDAAALARAGNWDARSVPGAHDRAIGRPTAIEQVKLRSRIVLSERYEKPRLNPRDDEQIREVLGANTEFKPNEGRENLNRFRWLTFRHTLFTGRGEQLLRYLGVPGTRKGFLSFLARLYPAGINSWFLRQANADDVIDETSCQADIDHMATNLPGHKGAPSFPIGWRALRGPGGSQDPVPTPQDEFESTAISREIDRVLSTLPRHLEEVVRRRFGLNRPEQTLREIAQYRGTISESVRQLEARALRLLRHPSRSKRLKSLRYD